MQSSVPRRRGAPLRMTLFWAIAAGAAGFIALQGITARKAHLEELATRAEDSAVPIVRLVSPSPVAVSGALTLPGRLDAYSRAPLYARINGYIAKWYTDIGARVKAGDLLAEIEAPELDQQLRQAESDLKNAEANAALAEVTAKRYEALLPSSFVSKQAADEKTSDYIAKQALVRSNQANLERLRVMSGFKRIVAPFSGVIIARNTDVGALINSGSSATPLFVAADTHKLRLYVNVPQTYVPLIAVGSTADFSVPEYPGRNFTAVVEAMSQSVDVASGTTQVLLMVDNANESLLSGSYTSVKFKLPPRNNVFEIPASALIFDGGGLRVATMQGQDTVVLKQVKIGRDLGKTLHIVEGLSASDRVIDNPPDGLSEGDKVHAKTESPQPGPAAKS